MKAAVICSKGLGDGLMMMIASYQLQLKGYEVTTFQDQLFELTSFFPDHHFAKREEALLLEGFDLVILQNDNSPFSFRIIDRYRPILSVFYSSYENKKHYPLQSMDHVFTRKKMLTENIAESTASLLKNHSVVNSNGISIPPALSYRKFSRRILIHPTSTTLKRTYSTNKFIKVAKILQKKGYEPVFCVSPKERETWKSIVKNAFPLPKFPTLKELAQYIYESHFLIGNESGTGHLASNLKIPTLIIASCPKQMALWRPGFFPGKVVTPPQYIPNFKGWRLRTNHWQYFISPRRVIKEFFS